MRLLGSFDLHRRNIFIVFCGTNLSEKFQLLKSFDANESGCTKNSFTFLTFIDAPAEKSMNQLTDNLTQYSIEHRTVLKV